MQEAVERAIATMWHRYDEPLTLADIADTAILSKFYFSRVFRTLTGTSPSRFLAAVRLCMAKKLLLETSESVTDISFRVGYNSLGTFTSRFTRSVGVPPARFRMMSELGMSALPRALRPSGPPAHRGGTYGEVSVPDTDLPIRIYVAAFKESIPEGQPRSCDILEEPGAFRLAGLPDGQWFVRVAVVPSRPIEPRPWVRQPLFIGATREPVVIRNGAPVETDILTRPFCAFDIPILLALPELDGRPSYPANGLSVAASGTWNGPQVNAADQVAGSPFQSRA
ncbi:helix-turn-helix transcriptional regulator [Kitasatospora cinereorecta]|uniref:Helix-turn-helix transcriptional regulator n=1 Tax=Kitasatospora cinereorecta TaxID=285560 RepID=A0ABW0VIU0_9ACTN